jgi:hypothetical protein
MSLKDIKLSNYYFIIEKETSNIICKSLETNETIATSVTPYISDYSDFWTSMEIDGELFDINIYYENDYSDVVYRHDEFNRFVVLDEPELIKKGVADSLQLYKLLKDDEGVYTTDCADFVTYGLTFKK